MCLTAKLLLALISTVILGSESHVTHDHILLSDSSGSLIQWFLYSFSADQTENTAPLDSSIVE
jgi:hypothetical protein